MAPLLFLLIIIAHLAGSHGDVTTVKDLVVLEGRSVTVPCQYEPQYARHVKYWCYGASWAFCSSLARSDRAPTAGSKLSLTDDPTQEVFTVTMTDLQEADSGWYWCAVEVGGIWRTDDASAVRITVSHGMSVVNNMLAGEEGSSVSVECLYGSRHSGSSKKWCRSGDWASCLEVASNGTLEKGAVLLGDDGAGAFRVTVRALEPGDRGWYWCSTGQQNAQVHIAVMPRTSPKSGGKPSPPIMTSLPADPSVVTSLESTAYQGPYSPSHVFESPFMICGLLLLLVIAAVVPWKMWHQYQRIRERRGGGEAKQTFTSCSGADDQCKADVFVNPSSSPHVRVF